MFRAICFSVMLLPVMALSQDDPVVPEPPMTIDRLSEIVTALDPDVIMRGPAMEFTLEDIPIVVIADPGADRMRAMVPIASLEDVSAEEMTRMMQANFDTALDARYAVAQDRVWGVYIHPLAALERAEFLSGIAQTVNLARSYGSTYSGGAQVFGGGDSNGIYEDLLQDLLDRGQDI